MRLLESWKSKTVQAGFAVFVVTVLMNLGIQLPYELIYSALGAYGVYGVRDAIDKIQNPG